MRTSVSGIKKAVLVPGFLLGLALPSFAGSEIEREQLQLVLKQLAIIDSLVMQADASQQTDRYRLDYEQLRADVRAVKGGIEGYLTPERAQPRDLRFFSGDYRKGAEDGHD